MLLYHGSNAEVSDPRIIKSNRALDFGTAFYAISDYEQAKNGQSSPMTAKKAKLPQSMNMILTSRG